MLIVALGVLAAAASPTPVKLASVGFVQLNLTPELASVYAETYANKLQACGGISVLTPKDIAAVLGIERQKQLLGCSDESSSCSAEIAGALGVDGVIRGDVARVGTAYQINIRVLNAKSGASIAVYSKQADSEESLLAGIAQAAKDAAPKVHAALDPAGTAGAACIEPPSQGISRRWAAVPGGLGVISLGIGAGFWASAGLKYSALQGTTTSYADAVTLRDTGSQQQNIGVALVAAGAVLVIAAALWFLLGGSP